VHPAGGLGWLYAGLLDHLPNRPLYALQARSLREPDQRPATIEAMAADYLAQIRTVQPCGPYHLLGWSFGCHVAHAIATMLQDRGEGVSQLMLLDSYPVRQGTVAPEPTDQELIELLVRALSDTPAELGNRPHSIPDLKRHLDQAGHRLALLDDQIFEAILREFKEAPPLLTRFSPGVFHGDLLFFRAMRGLPDGIVPPTPDLWQPHVKGRITAHDMACSHDSMMRPAALAQIGPILAAALDQM
ncbi:MAG TPA: alpha/beta fold hydrolase, partial [Steroidobacteraceae bacterium]|nr:alpha/beta fold hydrolase [Steroidobacteraceae bacterium]